MEVKTITADTTVGELVRAVPSRSRIFENLGIDYCCGGKKPLAEICKAKHLDPATVIAMLAALDGAPTTAAVDPGENGARRRLIDDDGLRGMTSNPSIFEKAIAGSQVYEKDVKDMVFHGQSPKSTYETLSQCDIRGAVDEFRTVYDKEEGGDGFVSLEVIRQVDERSDGKESPRIVTPPRLDKVAGHCSEILKELDADLGTEGTKETSRRTDPATKVGSASKAIDFDAIQLSRALARWENEGGAGKYTLKKFHSRPTGA